MTSLSVFLGMFGHTDAPKINLCPPNTSVRG